MHDPYSMVFDLGNILTIWHKDPERDGTDDSCGWFIRSRHCDQTKLKRIASDFAYQWSHGIPYGWFAENGEPNFSPQAIVIGMFRVAANIHFGHWSDRANEFLAEHAFEILFFAENNCDSLCTFITQHYGRDPQDTVSSRSMEAAQIVYSWICRADRPWWRHPRFHFWHWKIQFHPWQRLRRRWWDKCCLCGKRGFKGDAMGSGNGDKIWHQECDAKLRPPEQSVAN